MDGGDGVDPIGFGDFDHGAIPPARGPPPKKTTRRATRRAAAGERVAANIGEVTTGPGAQEWIVAVVVQYLPQELAYEVMDADDDAAAEGNVQTACRRSWSSRCRARRRRGTASTSRRAPRFWRCTEHHQFYRAVVVQQARKVGSGEYGDFLLEFEDDGDADGLPQRPVPFMHVVRHP